MLTYTLSLMKSIDIRSEPAVRLLAEFLDIGRENERRNAEQFAHGASLLLLLILSRSATRTTFSRSEKLTLGFRSTHRALLLPSIPLPRSRSVRRVRSGSSFSSVYPPLPPPSRTHPDRSRFCILSNKVRPHPRISNSPPSPRRTQPLPSIPSRKPPPLLPPYQLPLPPKPRSTTSSSTSLHLPRSPSALGKEDESISVAETI